jgi:hypothetical protein
MRQVIAALVIGWGLCAPAHTQNLFPLQAVPGGGGGGGACPGGDSGFVPAGYQCVLADTDEFSGSSGGVTYNDGDTINGKWQVHVSGYVPSMIQDNGYLASGMYLGGTFNGRTGAGLLGLFNLPDAPSYIEWRRRYVPSQTYGALIQMWTANSIPNQSGGPSTQEETDADMGEGCGGRGAVPASDPPGNCAGWADWSNPSAPQFFDFAYGSIPISNSSAWATIGMQRLPTPSPNGSIVITVNGVVQHTFTDAPNYYAFPSLGHTGLPDIFVQNLFCANPSASGGCPDDLEVDLDYVRVYTPCGNVVC